MLRQLWQLCTSDTSLFWIIVGSDLAIAGAYFAIPLTMAVVLRHRKEDIPYPWLWILFVTFIIACGITHVVHVISAVTDTEYLGLQASICVLTGLASVGTAVAFALVLPQIKLLPSPRMRSRELEKLVQERTKEKDQLIFEINHRVGNQLQILSWWRSGSGWNSVGVVSVLILESPGVGAPERRPRHDARYHEV
jgi:hypothetical protein